MYTCTHLIRAYTYVVISNNDYKVRSVTVKTFPKIGAFFCKGLPACMHIGHDSTDLLPISLYNLQEANR